MRVIAGSAGGLRLEGVKGTKTRPTQDRVKEALFSILSPLIPDAQVLDLFAGSGGLGIEALSRGATRALFVDNAPASIAVIHKNLQHTRLGDRARVWRTDAEAAVRRLAREGGQFDLIFADPPYGLGYAGRILRLLGEAQLLRPGGRVAIEHASKEEMDERAQNLTLVRRNRYGDTAVSLYTLLPTEQAEISS